MFRFSINVEFGRVSEPGEPGALPGEGGPGGAQVEMAHEQSPGLRVGFHRADEDF